MNWRSLVRSVSWRRYHRGLLWLFVAAAGLWSIDHLDWAGLSPYSIRRLGALWTIAAVVWGAYRISRDVCRIDPSKASTPGEAGMQHLARAILVGLLAVAACVAV